MIMCVVVCGYGWGGGAAWSSHQLYTQPQPQSWVHDPKLTDDAEVKASIKLRFRTQNDRRLVVIRCVRASVRLLLRVCVKGMGSAGVPALY